MSIQEIRKDAFDFHREILINGENARTGKIEAEKIIKYREDKLRQKSVQIKKFSDKIKTLEGQITKTDQMIKKKIELGDDLKFIHFHKLQIENKKYVAEIDEKNKKLLRLKHVTGNIVKDLNEMKLKLEMQEKSHKDYVDQIHTKKKILEKKKKEIKSIKKKQDKLTNEMRDYMEQQEQIQNMVDVIFPPQ